MPKYTYECLSCGSVFECRHGMTETLDECTHCGAEDVERRISDFTLESKSASKNQKETGSEVKKFIEETKKEIKEERKSLSSRVIK
jgi:putative FmdB family regulatory protein